MKKQVSVLLLTLGFMAVLDLAVAGALAVTQGWGGKFQALQRYFEYGRSVPGKLERWVENPQQRDNMFDIAWISRTLENSEHKFADDQSGEGLMMRSYGMSFAAGIVRSAEAQSAGLRSDLHGGPAAPPNMVYDVFLKDRPNRRSGDIVLLGILSSSTPAMAAMSNRTWSFEQPAPLTYPVFLPEGDTGTGLRRIEPLMQTPAQQRLSIREHETGAPWRAQLREHDRFYTAAAFGMSALDISPFARLVRRSLAIKSIEDRERALIRPPDQGGFPYRETLQRMIVNFAQIARADGQVPVVLLIQSRDPEDLDVLEIARPVLAGHDIPYVATVDHANPRDPALFIPDGHYTKTVNEVFGQALLTELSRLGLRP